MKKKKTKKELHELCKCKDCERQREISKKVLDSWVQLEAGRIAREIIYGKPKTSVIWDEAKDAWKGLNDSLKVNPICNYCKKELTHNLRLYCACGHAFCSVKCSNQYHSEKNK